MNIPSCGTAYVQYSKLCGNPLQPRIGQQIRNTIVRDGLIVNPSYFDPDLDNDVTRVPFNQQVTQFQIYIRKGSDQEMEGLGLEGLSNAVVQKIRVDADQTIINVKAKSILLHGGIIDQSIKTLSLSYECLGRSLEATIEMNIQLKNYKDITLFFVKQCEGKQGFNLFATSNGKNDHHSANIVAHVFFYLLLLYVIVMLCRTVISKQISPDNIPFYHQIKNVTDSIVELVKNKVKKQTEKFKTLYENDAQDYELVAQQYKSDDEKIEKDKQVSYGTI